MESWKDASEVKNPLLSDGIGLPADALGRPRKMSMGWNTKLSCNSDDMVGSSRETVESMEFMELGLPDMVRKSDHSDPNLNVLDGEIGNYFSSTLLSPTSMITSNSSFGELESGLSLSSSFIVSDCQKSSLIDLKLGRFVGWGEAKNRCSNEGLVLSSVGSSLTSKRVRTANFYPQNSICQVRGCNKDLSSSKDYYKRHKVCDVHSKTSRVTVNGIQQRFCQQCSRFHLLAEFDDGKRSCRKRLAGHNERRRKPQLDILSGKSHKLFQYYEGVTFLQTSLPKRSSFVLPDMLPGGFFNPQGNFQGNICNHVKVGEEPIYCPQLAIPTRNSQSHSKPIFNMQGIGKQCSSEILSSPTGHTYIETTSAVQGSLGVPNPGAHSLLSAHSKNVSSHMTGSSMVSPLLAPDTDASRAVDLNSEKVVGTSIDEKFPPNGFCFSRMSSMKVDQLRPPVIFDACSSIAFGVQADWIFQRSDSMKSKSCVPPEDGPTVDLIQLSSHLQRVEQERNSIQLKHENEAFCFQTAKGF